MFFLCNDVMLLSADVHMHSSSSPRAVRLNFVAFMILLKTPQRRDLS